MADDIFDTRFEGKEVEIEDNRIILGADFNLTGADPTLRNVLIGAGWDLNAFNADALDLDLSLFLLTKDNTTRGDADFIFYNQPVALDGGIKHNGDSRTGAGDGDDENILIDVQAVPFDILQILVVVTIYKGFEKEQNLDMVRNAYVRVVNADTNHELCRYELDAVLDDKMETGVIVGALNREGPKWHFKPMDEFVEGGLGEMARRYGMIINQE